MDLIIVFCIRFSLRLTSFSPIHFEKKSPLSDYVFNPLLREKALIQFKKPFAVVEFLN